MNNFIKLKALSVSERNSSSAFKRLTVSVINKKIFCTDTIFVNIDKIVNYTYPTRHSYYYKEDYNTEETYKSLDVFEVKMDNGDVYFIEKEYFEQFKEDIENINKERYVKNINVMSPLPVESRKRRK